MRPGHCYLQVRGQTCERSLASNLTMKQCCCSIGRGWTSVEDEQRRRPCTPCPLKDTSQSDTLPPLPPQGHQSV